MSSDDTNRVNKTLANATGNDNVGNSINKAVSTFGNQTNSEIGKIGGNISTQMQRGISATAYGFKTGDFTGFENLYNLPNNLTGGPLAPDAPELAAKQEADQKTALANRDVELQAKAQLDAKNNLSDSIGKQRIATPGRSQTLLTANYGNPGGSNTLLTVTNRGG